MCLPESSQPLALPGSISEGIRLSHVITTIELYADVHGMPSMKSGVTRLELLNAVVRHAEAYVE